MSTNGLGTLMNRFFLCDFDKKMLEGSGSLVKIWYCLMVEEWDYESD